MKPRHTSIATMLATVVPLAIMASYMLVESHPSASKIFYLGAAVALLVTGVFTGLRGC